MFGLAVIDRHMAAALRRFFLFLRQGFTCRSMTIQPGPCAQSKERKKKKNPPFLALAVSSPVPSAGIHIDDH